MTGLDTVTVVSGTWESKFARLRQLALNTHTKKRKLWAPYAVMRLSEPEAPQSWGANCTCPEFRSVSTPLCQRQSRPHHLAYTGNEDSSAGGTQSFHSG